MGNAAVAEELPALDELEELYQLDASESEPEDESSIVGRTERQLRLISLGVPAWDATADKKPCR